MNWIDVVALSDEGELHGLLQALSLEELADLEQQLLQLLGLTQEMYRRQAVRILVERARPLALPEKAWRRMPGDSGPLRPVIEDHLAKISVDSTPTRLRELSRLVSNFVDKRVGGLLTESFCRDAGFRCAICGYAFVADDMVEYGYVSPYMPPNREPDPFKPNSQSKSKRVPRVDHVWPVSLYGSNASKNLQLLCSSCNSGKKDFMTNAHADPFVGQLQRISLRKNEVTEEVFYSVVSRDRFCSRCGKGPSEVELTVRPRRENFPVVADNLVTVCYECSPSGTSPALETQVD